MELEHKEIGTYGTNGGRTNPHTSSFRAVAAGDEEKSLTEEYSSPQTYQTGLNSTFFIELGGKCMKRFT